MNKQITDKFTDLTLSINDIVQDKLNKTYSKQYEYAIQNYLTAINEDNSTFWDNHIIVNRTAKSFSSAPEITILEKSHPFKKVVVDLTQFWPEYQFNNTSIPIVYNADDDFGEYELTYIDYARQKAFYINRYTNVTVEAPISSITKDTKISDELSLDNTFRKLLDKLSNGDR